MKNKKELFLVICVCFFFAVMVIVYVGFNSATPFFRAFYRDCSRINYGMSVDKVVSILDKYNMDGYLYNINSFSGTVGVAPEIHYDISVNVYTEKFEGDCTAYIKDGNVVYIESIFD